MKASVYGARAILSEHRFYFFLNLLELVYLLTVSYFYRCVQENGIKALVRYCRSISSLHKTKCQCQDINQYGWEASVPDWLVT